MVGHAQEVRNTAYKITLPYSFTIAHRFFHPHPSSKAMSTVSILYKYRVRIFAASYMSVGSSLKLLALLEDECCRNTSKVEYAVRLVSSS